MTSKQIHLNFSKTSLTGADLWPWHTACALFFTELSRRKALDRGWTRFQHYWYTICNFCQSFSTFVNFSNLLSTLASIWRLLTTFFWRMMRIWAVWLSEGNCLTRGDWLAADVAPAASRYSQPSDDPLSGAKNPLKPLLRATPEWSVAAAVWAGSGDWSTGYGHALPRIHSRWIKSSNLNAMFPFLGGDSFLKLDNVQLCETQI